MSDEVVEKVEVKEAPDLPAVDKASKSTINWVRHGIFVVIIGALVAWASFGVKINESDLDKTCRVVNVASESVTFGYLAARQAELVPENVQLVVDNIGESLLDASAAIEAEKIDMTEVKTMAADAVNKLIDEKLEGNVLYKTLADILINAGINAAQTYINEAKEVKAADYVKIIAAMRAGIITGAAPFVNQIEAATETPAVE